MLVAAGNPGRVASLSLIAPAGIGKPISGAFLDGFLAEVRGKKLRPVIEMLVADPDMVTSDMVEDVLKFKRLDGAQAALSAIRSANFAGSEQSVAVADALAGLKVPVQVIVGGEDRIIPPDQTKALPDRIAKTVIAGAGHIPAHGKVGRGQRRLDQALGLTGSAGSSPRTRSTLPRNARRPAKLS